LNTAATHLHCLQAVTSFLGQYYSPDDLSKFQKTFGLTPLAIETTIGPNDDSKPGVEASLDVQYLTGVNNDTIRTWVWSTAGEMSGGNEPFLDWLQAVDNTTNGMAELRSVAWLLCECTHIIACTMYWRAVPNLFSISYQDLEYTVSLSYATSVNNEFMKNTVRGITFITGSGDWGVGCEDPQHCTAFTSDFPSSSPYVTSTGGTTISGTANEVGVAFSSGGFSNYFGQPSYQAAAVQKWMSLSGRPPTSFYNTSGRAFPDISAVSTNFQVFVHGVVMPVAGTSASTPTVAAMLSMINSLRYALHRPHLVVVFACRVVCIAGHATNCRWCCWCCSISQNKPALGNVNPALYAAWSAQPKSFNDITANQPQQKGCCPYSFSATVGWDPVTGLGTPNYGYLANYMVSSANFNFPNNDQ
jgi:tripeptidyl-peptidase I